jgi:outer membrane protein assembly factor BamB
MRLEESYGQLDPATDGGVLVSTCGSAGPWRVNADGSERIPYAFQEFSSCGPNGTFAEDGSAYFNGYRGIEFGIQAMGPGGKVRWTHIFGEDLVPRGAPALAGGTLWFTRWTGFKFGSDLIGLNRRTGATVFRSGPQSNTLPAVATAAGPIVVEQGWRADAEPAQVNWFDNDGTLTQTAALPGELDNWRSQTAVGQDRAVFVAGCSTEPVGVEMRTPTGGSWSWAGPTGEFCRYVEITATPDGGIVVGRPATLSPLSKDGTATYTKVDATGQELWTHSLTPPIGRLVKDFTVIPPQVAASGQVVVGGTYSWPCNVGRCRRGFIEVLDPDGTVARVLVVPALRYLFPYGTNLTDLVLGPDQIYVLLESSKRERSFALALSVPGISR